MKACRVIGSPASAGLVWLARALRRRAYSDYSTPAPICLVRSIGHRALLRTRERSMRSEQSQYDRVVWQVSGGPADRSYVEVFLRYGVALIGPGNAAACRHVADRRDRPGRRRLRLSEPVRRRKWLGSPAHAARPLVSSALALQLQPGSLRRQPAAPLARSGPDARGLRRAVRRLAADPLADCAPA